MHTEACSVRAVQKGPKQGQRSVLLVGNPALPLKGFDVAIAVLAMVNRVLPVHVTWICQTQPSAAMVPGLATSGLRINLHISPAQVRHTSQFLTPADTAPVVQVAGTFDSSTGCICVAMSGVCCLISCMLVWKSLARTTHVTLRC